MVDFSELLVKRRSVRDFMDKEVPLDLIKEIIHDCCLAPSAGHGQPWRFSIINNKEQINKLSEVNKKTLLSYIEKNPETPLRQYEAAMRDATYNIFYNAPCLIYIVGPKEVPSYQVDCTFAACYFMFSATTRGLGTCWVGLGTNIRDPEILRELGILENYRIVAPIIVGYPKTIPAPRERNEPQILAVVS
ncbi:MAG: nitroreductase family protein [Thermodesulfobacteriota bacterium]|nr:nitroreductase family protein [Thermodesulfobacteriota bacterium]